MIPYPKKADTPKRLLRKSQRSKVFEANRKAAKLRRKADRKEKS